MLLLLLLDIDMHDDDDLALNVDAVLTGDTPAAV